jgi:tetratricopeptide (TPR) repeat protein
MTFGQMLDSIIFALNKEGSREGNSKAIELIAKKCGVGESTIYQIVTGRYIPGKNVYKKLEPLLINPSMLKPKKSDTKLSDFVKIDPLLLNPGLIKLKYSKSEIENALKISKNGNISRDGDMHPDNHLNNKYNKTEILNMSTDGLVSERIRVFELLKLNVEASVPLITLYGGLGSGKSHLLDYISQYLNAKSLGDQSIRATPIISFSSPKSGTWYEPGISIDLASQRIASHIVTGLFLQTRDIDAVEQLRRYLAPPESNLRSVLLIDNVPEHPASGHLFNRLLDPKGLSNSISIVSTAAISELDVNTVSNPITTGRYLSPIEIESWPQVAVTLPPLSRNSAISLMLAKVPEEHFCELSSKVEPLIDKEIGSFVGYQLFGEYISILCKQEDANKTLNSELENLFEFLDLKKNYKMKNVIAEWVYIRLRPVDHYILQSSKVFANSFSARRLDQLFRINEKNSAHCSEFPEGMPEKSLIAERLMELKLRGWIRETPLPSWRPVPLKDEVTYRIPHSIRNIIPDPDITLIASYIDLYTVVIPKEDQPKNGFDAAKKLTLLNDLSEFGRAILTITAKDFSKTVLGGFVFPHGAIREGALGGGSISPGTSLNNKLQEELLDQLEVWRRIRNVAKTLWLLLDRRSLFIPALEILDTAINHSFSSKLLKYSPQDISKYQQEYIDLAEIFLGRSKINWRVDRYEKSINDVQNCRELIRKIKSNIPASRTDLQDLLYMHENNAELNKKIVFSFQSSEEFGETCMKSNELDSLITNFKKMKTKNISHFGEAYTFYWRGRIKWANNDMRGAIEDFKECLSIADKVDDYRLIVQANQWRARCHMILNEWAEAKTYLSSAFNFTHQVNDEGSQAQAEGLMSILRMVGVTISGERNLSIEEAAQGLAAVNIRYWEGILYLEAARVSRNLGNSPDKYIQLFHECWKSIKPLKESFLAVPSFYHNLVK